MELQTRDCFDRFEVVFERRDMSPEFFRDNNTQLSQEQAIVIAWTIALEGADLWQTCEGKYTEEQFALIEKEYINAINEIRHQM